MRTSKLTNEQLMQLINQQPLCNYKEKDSSTRKIRMWQLSGEKISRHTKVRQFNFLREFFSDFIHNEKRNGQESKLGLRVQSQALYLLIKWEGAWKLLRFNTKESSNSNRFNIAIEEWKRVMNASKHLKNTDFLEKSQLSNFKKKMHFKLFKILEQFMIGALLIT